MQPQVTATQTKHHLTEQQCSRWARSAQSHANYVHGIPNVLVSQQKHALLSNIATQIEWLTGQTGLACCGKPT